VYSINDESLLDSRVIIKQTKQVNEREQYMTAVKSEEKKQGIGRGRPRKYDYPAQLTCSVTGKIVKTNPSQFKKQLEASGKDMATFIKTYVCRSARKGVASKVEGVATAPASIPVTESTEPSEGE
jgi:hypothetical protein